MEVWFYFLDIWEGSPYEGSEMGIPQFFTPDTVPYEDMMPGDKVVILNMIAGEFMKGKLFLGKKDEHGKALFIPT